MTPDELEAESKKYCSPTVVALSSGRFAVYLPHNGTEMPRFQVCGIDQLQAAIITATAANILERYRPPTSIDDLIA